MLANLSDSGRWFQRTDAAVTKLSPPIVRTVLGSRSVMAFWVDHDLCVQQVVPWGTLVDFHTILYKPIQVFCFQS